jgi:hypothetical protein
VSRRIRRLSSLAGYFRLTRVMLCHLAELLVLPGREPGIEQCTCRTYKVLRLSGQVVRSMPARAAACSSLASTASPDSPRAMHAGEHRQPVAAGTPVLLGAHSMTRDGSTGRKRITMTSRGTSTCTRPNCVTKAAPLLAAARLTADRNRTSGRLEHAE